MKLIVWLGNPWKEYANTRHNAGFLLIDSFAKREKIKWIKKKEWNAEIATWEINEQEVVLCKPLTYINKSGESVSKIAKFYKIKPEDILLIHDEIDLQSGEIKMKQWGWHAWHNGLRSLITHLGTNTFSRIRVGVGRPVTKEEVVEYVLHPFTKTEWEAIEKQEEKIFQMIYEFVQ